MRITIAFAAVVATILIAGTAYRRWDVARHLRFLDESGTAQSLRPLIRFESRSVLTHPTWLITLGIVTALVSTLLLLESGGTVQYDAPVGWFAMAGLPLAGLALVVSLHRIGTRSRRNNTDELEASMPTAPRTRTLALLAACLAPVPVLALAVGAALVISRLSYPQIPAPTVANMLPISAFVLVPIGGAVVGVFLSRWLPFLVAPLLGIVAIVWLNNGVDHLHPRFRWLRAAVESDYGRQYDVRPYGWAVVFVVGLIALGGCLALWRHPGRPQLVAATAASLLMIVGAGWTMTRSPSTAEIQDRVDLLESPTEHQYCETRDVVTYCVEPGVADWIDEWDPAVRAVLAQIPSSARPEMIEVVQRPVVGIGSYLPEIGDAMDPAAVWAADGRLHPPLDLENERFADMTVAWQTAALAVGLPPATTWDNPSGCMAGGQSRIVLAHLLAGRASPTTAPALSEKAADSRGSNMRDAPVPMDLSFDYSSETTHPMGAEVRREEQLSADGSTLRDFVAVSGASGWGSDVYAAEALMRADSERVDEVILANWDELVDPNTPTARFLHLAGVEPRVDLTGPPGHRSKPGEPHSCP